MEILLFVGGFLTGAIAVFGVFALNKNSNKKTQTELTEQMQLCFENTAMKIFNENSKEFSIMNKENLEEFFKRFREKIEEFEKRSEENFKNEIENFTRFDTNIKNFIEAGNKISQDTNALVNVMRSDNRKQGHWGEIVLEKVLEASGLRNGEEFMLQKGFDEKRPDAVVLLPENRCVYIDAKTSFASFDAYINSEDDIEREENLKKFKDSTKLHISNLSKKDYASGGDRNAFEFVLMFIPIESCYSMLFCDDSAMWDFAWKNKIMPTSPSTLLASLKIINSFHMVNRQNKNAIEITRLCTKMLDKFADMLKDILGARKSIVSALKKLEGRDSILVNINKLNELGAVMTKSIPEINEEIFEEV